MTQDVIVNTTTEEFIVGNKEYLKLAFMVEKVAPKIRKKAVENVLKRVEKRLNERFGSGDWVVELLRDNPDRPQAVRIKKESWREKLMFDHEKGWEGIRINRDTWVGCASVTVGPFEKGKSTEIKEQIEKLFRECNIGMPEMTTYYARCRLEGDLKDWNGADFVFDALNEPDKIADDLAGKLEKLAREVDQILGGEQPQAGS